MQVNLEEIQAVTGIKEAVRLPASIDCPPNSAS
jgi:hypothetical protein